MTISVATQFAVSNRRFASLPAERRGVRRDQVKLLVASPDGVSHKRFNQITDVLRAGDVLVVNNSAMVAAQYDGVHSRLGPVVCHVGRSPVGPIVELRTAPDAATLIDSGQPGDTITVQGATLELHGPYPQWSSPTGNGNRLWRVGIDGSLPQGKARPIAYGYLDRPLPVSDYRTVFGCHAGSVEMASASRPFTDCLVKDLTSRGVQFAPITLHTGFSSQEVHEAPLPEWRSVSRRTAALVNAARADGRRVIAVGTTAARAIESSTSPGAPTLVAASQGWTGHVIGGDHPAQFFDGLITGWHDPEASHLALVESVAGEEVTQAAYTAAVTEGYLWHEFGDTGLLLRRP